MTGRAGDGAAGTYAVWALMAAPGAILVCAGLLGVKLAFVNLSGVLAGVFLALTLLVTPAQRAFGPLPWLKGRRRHLGVASFGYFSLHMAVWLAKVTPERFFESFLRPELLTGWIAGLIMLPLAATSFDRAVRAMGSGWKRLHRWAYAVAALTIAHWWMAGDWIVTSVAASVPVAAAELWRYLRHRSRQGSQRRT